jgi:hypothetical protein
MVLEEEHAAGDTPLDHALDEFLTGLDHLIKAVEDGGLDYFDDLQLLQFFQSFERGRNRMSLVDHRLVADAEGRDLAGRYLHKTLKSLLASTLRLSPAEAQRRVRAAAAVGDRMSAVGEKLDALRPRLAAAQRAGEVSAEQVDVIERAVDQVDLPGLACDERDRAEEILTRNALTFGPVDLRRIAVHLVDAIQPDGTLPREQLNSDRRFLHLTSRRDGSYLLEGRLTGSVGAQLNAILSPLAKPRQTMALGADGVERLVADERHHGQRMHDALDDACGRLLRAGGLPASGGTPATVIVTIDAQQLLDQTGHGETSDGVLLSTSEILRLANEAEVLPAVLTQGGALLDMGRSRRIANTTQTFALIARDGGCSFPGCTHPAEWCDRHHIKGWIHGGKTAIDNLTLLCRYHHTHFASRGWDCQLNGDAIPEWVPPRWQDKHRRPLINDRIRRRHVGRRLRT